MYNVFRKGIRNPERRPFKAILDVGLMRTTTGARVFGALKGACDGGLHIPHHPRRFPGCSKSRKKRRAKYNAENHRNRIFGLHIQTYLDKLWEKDEDHKEYLARFSQWDKCVDAWAEKLGQEEATLEEIYTAVHKAIRENPEREPKKVREQVKHEVSQVIGLNSRIFKTQTGEYRRDRRLTNAERKQRVAQKIKIHTEMQA